MLYDIKLTLRYAYEGSVHGDRHLVRVVPMSLPGVQRVVASSLSFDPEPDEQRGHADFFGNAVTAVAYTGRHSHFEVRLTARVAVDELPEPVDVSSTRADLPRQLAALWSLTPQSPHHFVGPSTRIVEEPAITAYASAATAGTRTVQTAALALCLAIYRDFAYDSEATLVDTSTAEAFALRRGVCQDFAHVMIAGLRGLGIPAGYVSGYLRTIPAPGQARLEGADAMHAWVRAWCGPDTGWLGFDPTNAMMAGADHIAVGHGRDYADVSPIVGMLRSAGGTQEASQAVDVVRVG